MTKKKNSYDILKETFCLYCQHDYGTPRKLQNHVRCEHPGLYAYMLKKKTVEKTVDG